MKGAKTTRIVNPPPVPAAHRLVHFLYAQMVLNNLTRHRLARMAGVGTSTLHGWWGGKRIPNIENMEACLMALGYNLKPGALPRETKP